MKMPKYMVPVLIAGLLVCLLVFLWIRFNQPHRREHTRDITTRPSQTDQVAVLRHPQLSLETRTQAISVLSSPKETGTIPTSMASAPQEQQNRKSLTDQERRILRSLWNDFALWEKTGPPILKPKEAEMRAAEIGAICVKHRLKRSEIMSLVGCASITNGIEMLGYPYGIEKALCFAFDKNGNLIGAGLAGQPPLFPPPKP
jgi:hypothetical protein